MQASPVKNNLQALPVKNNVEKEIEQLEAVSLLSCLSSHTHSNPSMDMGYEIKEEVLPVQLPQLSSLAQPQVHNES